MESAKEQVAVSVVITCYNYGKYLTRCIQSVLEQTLQNVEIIIVNDGSIDETDAVVQHILPREGIRYIKQENAGQANAKNTGIKNSKGEYIAFLDADDIWEPNKLEKQIRLFANRQVGVVYSRARYINEVGAELEFKLSGKYLQPRSGHVTSHLFIDNFVPFSSSVVRRTCLDEFRGFDESLKMGIDWDLWLRISTRYEFDFVDEPLLIYRMGHPDQMSKNAEERQRCSDRIMHQFLDRFPGAISRELKNAALAYTHCNRGDYLRDRDIVKSFRMYIQALKYRPFILRPYKALIKNILQVLFCQH
jgi:glycosyltransferase involved in cell wall biosynthesis